MTHQTTEPSSERAELTDSQIDEIAEQHATGQDDQDRYIVTTAELREIIKDAAALLSSDAKPVRDLVELLRDTRHFVEAGLHISEHGSKSQSDIFKAAEILARIDAALLSSDAKPVVDGELPLIVDESVDEGKAVVKNGCVFVACAKHLTTSQRSSELLPMLPEDEELGDGVYGYTADQMRDYARAALLAATPAAGGGEEVPPFGSKRKAAMAIYTPPFKFSHGYIHDSKGHMVADQDGLDGEVEKSVVARVRGWGRIGYMPNPEELQDEVGQMMADALTAYYTHPQPARTAEPLTEIASWSILAARALDDAHRVLETIEPEYTSEAEMLEELRNRVQELFVQALVLNGFKTRAEMDAAKHFNRLAIYGITEKK